LAANFIKFLRGNMNKDATRIFSTKQHGWAFWRTFWVWYLVPNDPTTVQGGPDWNLVWPNQDK
jgi:hypothetical protein